VYDFHEISAVKNKFGVVNFNSDGKLLSFIEKPADPLSSIAATGIYLIKSEDIQHIHAFQSHPQNNELNLGSLIMEMVTQSISVYCFLVPKWFDIGTIEDLRKANIEYSTL
jgi:dTDP-glucose pyrophosphorylase